MQFIGIIPARYASTRFPGKPLVEIQGKSMIQRVYEQARKASCLSHVLVATDDQRIHDHVHAFGNVVYTNPHHPSGTDRCFEAASLLGEKWNIAPSDVIVNIQGDEPFIHPEQIQAVCDCFNNPAVNIATLVKKIDARADIFNENVVKVTRASNGKALYFSRLPIPFLRNVAQEEWLSRGTWYRHIGLYAYTFSCMNDLSLLKPSALEKAESLEQLRWLENGFDIFTHETQHHSQAVDTPEDLKNFKEGSM